MRYLTNLWRNLRQPDNAAALLCRKNTLLAGENATLAEITALLRRELKSTQAQLLASRAEHDSTLRRLAATEADFAEVCDELRRCRRRERRQRRAMRGWITRTVKARVYSN